MPDLRLRAAVAADAAAIAALHTASWRDAYAALLDPAYLAGPIEADRLELWQGRFRVADPDLIVQVAEDEDGQVVGFVCAIWGADPQWGSLVDNLHTAPRLRGHGVGEKLLRSAASLLAGRDPDGGLYLWVFEANTAALRFYERLGGRVVGRDVSRIPAANGKTALRVHWPRARDVAQGVATSRSQAGT